MATIQPGFTDAASEAQTVFRTVLTALSRPGLAQDLPSGLRPPKPLTPELAAVALALADAEAPLWLDRALAKEPAVAEFLRFHTGAPIVSDASKAAFALVRRPDELPDLGLFARGSQDYPDRSMTIVLAVGSLEAGEIFSITGPGVKNVETFAVTGLPENFASLSASNHALFPRGIDWLLVGAGRVLGLPRSSVVTTIAAQEAA